MNIIETYYLIDYENVGSKGLIGYNELQRSDHVYIFYTKDAPNVGLDFVKEIINNREKAEVAIQEIDKKRKGDQSLDFCLASYLGYLIAVNRGKACSYVIVSKDDGYEAVKKFWNDSQKVEVSKRDTIKPAPEEESVKKTPSAKKTSSAKEAKVDVPGKTDFNQKIQEALRQAEYSAEDIGEVAALVTDCYDEVHPENLKRDVHNGLQKKYDTAKEIYHNIESVLGIYSAMPSSAGGADQETDKTVLNNRIQQILSKAKLSADVIAYVTSTVVKNIGVKNGKQQIYRSIVSKYGQKKGLDVYNRIKKYIP